MGGFGHGPALPAEPDDPRIAARNARYGLVLFAIYLVLYATFVGLNAFVPQAMSARVFGVNLAIMYGMLLIISAFLLALLYCWLCRATSLPSGETLALGPTGSSAAESSGHVISDATGGPGAVGNHPRGGTGGRA